MKNFGISRQALVAAVFGAAAVGTFTLSPKVFSPHADAQPIAIEAPQGAPLSFADLIERVEPSVVSVNVVSEREVGKLADMEQFFEQFRGMPGFDEFLQNREKEEKDKKTSQKQAPVASLKS